jgi:membrane-bound metal-dependent hydrolase YbcI (DUF457 family)
LYSALAHWRFDRAPSDGAALAVAFGTQFPDLVDKPLAWTFHLLPTGRSLAHSLLTATVVCLLVGWYARRRDRPVLAIAFATGYISHLFGDAIVPVLAGQYEYVTYLVWPLLELPPHEQGTGLIEQLAGLELTPLVLAGITLIALAFVVWLRDGRPGLSILRGWAGRWRRAAEH